MVNHANIKENKCQPASSAGSTQSDKNKSAIQLKDNRPGSIAQKKLVDSIAAKTLIQKKENKSGLPDDLKSGVENISGISMDDVKVHYHSDKPSQLNAHAYAQGTDIHIAPGQEKHLPHEAWHVVQQKQGRVRPTMQMKGKVDINDDKSLEKEADVMGMVASMKSKTGSSAIQNYAGGRTNAVAQLKIEIGDIVIENEYSLDLEELKAWKEKIDRQYSERRRETGYRRLLDIILVREKGITDIDGIQFQLNFKTEGMHLHLTNLKKIASSFSGGPPAARLTPPGLLPPPVQGGAIPAAASKVKSQEDNTLKLSHEVKVLQDADIPALVAALKEWQKYVMEMLDKYEILNDKSGRKKWSMKDGYYSDKSTQGFRADHKKIRQMYTDFRGAKGEIEAILSKLETGKGSYFYLVAIKDGIVQGILEKIRKDSDYISNIVVNPDNIEPRTGKTQVKGTLKDLLKTCVMMNLEGKKVDLELVALSSRVKKIYDHYGFRVEKEGAMTERPKVERYEPGGWRTPGGAKQTADLKKQKHPWFESTSMKMTVANQEKFLKDQYAK